MSLNVTFNGSMYIIPETGEVGWGGNTTSYLVAIAAGALQKTGGSFTLSAETDFGASFGLKSLYYKSRSANIAATGIVRLNNNSDSISWRNFANSSDLPLTVDASNRLSYNGNPVLTGTSPSAYVSSITGTTNQVIASGSTGAITLSLPQSINSTANVQFATLGLGSSVVASSILSLTSTTLGFLPPRVTTVERDAIVSPATGLFVYNTSTSVYNFYNGSTWVAIAAGGTINAGTQYQLGYYAANGTTISGLPLITGSRALQSDSNGLPVASSVTTTELGYLSGVTSAIQTQLNSKLNLTGGTLTGQLLISNGTVSAPSIAFAGGTTTGIYWIATDILSIAAGGVEAARFTSAGRILTPAGTAGSPSFSFITDGNSGMYDIADDILGFSVGATERLRISTTIIQSSLPLTITPTSNQIVLGVTNTTTINATAPSVSRTVTIPDPGANASFIMSEGSQTINGTKTFSSQVIVSAGLQTGSTIVSDTDNTDDLGTTSINFRNLYIKGSVIVGSTTAINLATSGAVSIRGTTTNDDAAAGFVGETVSSAIGTTAFPATGTFGDATSISLTAGDWLVGIQSQASSSTDTADDLTIGVSVNSGNSTTGLTTGDTQQRMTPNPRSTGNIRATGYIVSKRFSLSATTTIYLKYSATFTGTAPNLQGARLTAVRIR